MNTNNLNQLFVEIAETSSTNDKISLLQEYGVKFPNSLKELKYVLEYAVSPYITFGVKQFDMAEPLNHKDFNYDSKNIWYVVNQLRGNVNVSDEVRKMIFNFSAKMNNDQQELLRKILTKDLQCGISVANVNKAFPGLIPVFKVQLCNKYEDGKFSFPAYAEVKYNGTRNIAIIDNNSVMHFSRNGKENTNFQCFNEELLKLTGGVPCYIDGEVHGKGSSLIGYREAQRQSRRKKDFNDSSLVYVIWDILPLSDFNNSKSVITIENRRKQLVELFEETDFKKIKLSSSKLVENEKEAVDYYNKMLSKGKEGVILKAKGSFYTFKRDNNWVKLKEAHTSEFKIIKGLEGKGKLKGCLGSVVVVVKNENNKVLVRCPMGAGVSRNDAKTMWKEYLKDKNTLRSKKAEISYQNITPDGSLFLPKFVKVRHDV